MKPMLPDRSDRVLRDSRARPTPRFAKPVPDDPRFIIIARRDLGRAGTCGSPHGPARPDGDSGPVGVVRDGCRAARGLDRGRAQAVLRHEPTAEHEPPFRLADPPDRPADFPDRRSDRSPGRDLPALGRLPRSRAGDRCADPAASPPRGHTAGLRPCLAPRRPWPFGPPGPRPGAAWGRLRSRGPGQHPGPRPDAGGPRGRALGGRPGQAGARARAADPCRGPEHPPGRDGHRRRRSSRSLRLREADQPRARRAGRARQPVRRRATDFLLDPCLAREHVYRAVASRAVGWLADPARRRRADGRRIPPRPRVRHGGLRRKHVVLRRRLGTGPRLHRLSRLHLPGPLAVPVGGNGPEISRMACRRSATRSATLSTSPR